MNENKSTGRKAPVTRSAVVSALMTIILSTWVGTASASGEVRSAEGSVTGVPAILIILVVLALIVIGVIAVVRFIGRKAKGK